MPPDSSGDRGEAGSARSTVAGWLARIGLGRLASIAPKPPVQRYQRHPPAHCCIWISRNSASSSGQGAGPAFAVVFDAFGKLLRDGRQNIFVRLGKAGQRSGTGADMADFQHRRGGIGTCAGQDRGSCQQRCCSGKETPPVCHDRFHAVSSQRHIHIRGSEMRVRHGPQNVASPVTCR